MCRGSGCLGCLFKAFDLYVEGWYGGVLDGPKLALEGRNRSADLEHHADEVINPDVGSICLVDKGQEFIAELNN